MLCCVDAKIRDVVSGIDCGCGGCGYDASVRGRALGRVCIGLIHRICLQSLEAFREMMIRTLLAGLFLAVGFVRGGYAANVLTYHNDNLRTGWNPAETVLSVKTVPSLVLQQQVALDGQVDAQPLIVSGQAIAGGVYNVAYVVTENDTVYAIDSATGNVLASVSLGTAVPLSALPGGCNNNDISVGINATPVADTATNTLYVMAFSVVNGAPTYMLHALDLGLLTDQVPPAVVAPSAGVTGGGTVTFNPATQRARAALTESNGVIYAGFASYCDFGATTSRGWVAGWSIGALTALPDAQAIDDQGYNPQYYFLSSVWMSGFGLATDDQNGLFFSTGNSDAGTYNAGYNLSESVVNLPDDLSKVQGFFTPVGGVNGELNRDRTDADLGSGGVMLLPPQPGGGPNLAVAASKQGPFFLLNRDAISQNVKGNAAVLARYGSHGCWCGPSYFMGADGYGHVVESTGNLVELWRVETAPAPHLMGQKAATISSGQDPGFFTSVSSNGVVKNSAVIWALGRPLDSDPADMMLYAYNGANLALLWSGIAGNWPNANGANANIVPVVANGQVFVATYENLSIFGLPQAGVPGKEYRPVRPKARVVSGAPHEVWGRVAAVSGDRLTLTTAAGKTVAVDMSAAIKAGNAVALEVGLAADVRGNKWTETFFATAVQHAKPEPALWGTNH